MVSKALWEAIEGVANDEGLLLYDLELPSPQLLRVVVSRDVEQVTSGDCTKLCKRLAVYFSVEGQVLGLHEDVQVEVSSPGINRKLRLPKHFQGAVGERVKVCFRAANANGQAGDSPAGAGRGKGVCIGKLEEAETELVAVRDEQTGDRVSVRYEDIDKARIDFKWD